MNNGGLVAVVLILVALLLVMVISLRDDARLESRCDRGDYEACIQMERQYEGAERRYGRP